MRLKLGHISGQIFCISFFRCQILHGGQKSFGQMSMAFKCPQPNVTEVKCHNTLEWSKVRRQMSRGRMILWSNHSVVKQDAIKVFIESRMLFYDQHQSTIMVC